jgi:thioredoxin 2
MPGPVIACPHCGTKNRLPLVAKGTPRCAHCKEPLPWLVDAGDGDFDQVVDTKALVVVDLWAPWCGPCRMIAPVLDTLSKELAGKVKVVKVNVDNSPRIAMKHKAQSIPMILVMDHGEVVDTIVGAQPAPVLRNHITQALERRG